MKGIHVDPARAHGARAGGRHRGELDRATAVFGLATPERRRLEHRHRRAHARRRAGLADGPLRDGDRQPRSPPRSCSPSGDVVTASDGRRPRPVLGDPRWRRQLRHRHLVRVPRAPGRRPSSAAPSLHPLEAAPELFCLLPRVHRRPSRRARHAGRLPARARRIGDEALRGARSATAATTPTGPRPTSARCAQFGSPAADMIQRMPYPVVEHGRRLAVPGGRRSTTGSRRSSRTSPMQASRVMTDAFEQAPSDDVRARRRGLPRRGHARRPRPPRRTRTGSRATTSLLISQWTDPADTDAGIAWARETFDALSPYMADRCLHELPLGRRPRPRPRRPTAPTTSGSSS